ncbi:OadG family protein [Eubacterium sp.]|uniref:OadG family protein n=1 Tax=Eubacterium sp. TaxID=142586 RepID=UPI0025EE8435|nr:OadG family protein [uncultured Eubacterium sp.]
MDIFTMATNVVPDRSLAFTLTVVIGGIGIVLGALMVLILVFFAFGKIMSVSQARAKKKEAKKIQSEMQANLSKVSAAAPTPTPASAPAPVVEDGIPQEVVAAISAAVYAMDGGAGVVRSITKKTGSPITTRNPWAQAAVADNTRPF